MTSSLTAFDYYGDIREEKRDLDERERDYTRYTRDTASDENVDFLAKLLIQTVTDIKSSYIDEYMIHEGANIILKWSKEDHPVLEELVRQMIKTYRNPMEPAMVEKELQLLDLPELPINSSIILERDVSYQTYLKYLLCIFNKILFKYFDYEVFWTIATTEYLKDPKYELQLRDCPFTEEVKRHLDELWGIGGIADVNESTFEIGNLPYLFDMKNKHPELADALNYIIHDLQRNGYMSVQDYAIQCFLPDDYQLSRDVKEYISDLLA